HVIAGEHSDANGSYVALTRAREQTHLYASLERLDPPAEEADGGREAQLARLAAQLGRSEPELPSIATPLAHEQHAEREHAQQAALPAPSEGNQREQARVRRERAHAELERSRVELDQVRAKLREAAAVMSTQPHDQRVTHAHADAQHAGQQAQWAAARGEQLAAEQAKLGRLARLGERGRALKTQIAADRDRERAALTAQQHHRQEADTRQVELDQRRRAWDNRHPGALERHQAAEQAHKLAQQASEAAELAATGELLAATRPAPGARRHLAELSQEHARLQALGKQADPVRLAQVRAELGRLTAGSSEPSRPGLGRRPGFGPERPGPTIGR
ncbi:MAG: hypothetical protein M3Y09_13815, partial [Actinomycetota bacterium]|nr:hypothetical protein [Actinomycetota bacterium]